MLENFTKWLAGSASLNLLFLGLALLSLLTSIYFYLQSKREKKPVYLERQFLLVKSAPTHADRIKILYDDRVVEQLYVTKVALWNRGKETIHAHDIVASDSPRIVLSQDSALDVNVEYCRRNINNISVAIVNGEVLLSFDFLDRLDGAVISIYHERKCDVALLGSIKGCVGFSKARLDDMASLEKLLGPVVKTVFKFLPKPKEGSVWMWLAVFAFTPIAVIGVPLLVIENTVRLFQPVPKEYSL